MGWTGSSKDFWRFQKPNKSLLAKTVLRWQIFTTLLFSSVGLESNTHVDPEFYPKLNNRPMLVQLFPVWKSWNQTLGSLWVSGFRTKMNQILVEHALLNNRTTIQITGLPTRSLLPIAINPTQNKSSVLLQAKFRRIWPWIMGLKQSSAVIDPIFLWEKLFICWRNYSFSCLVFFTVKMCCGFCCFCRWKTLYTPKQWKSL